MLEATFYLVVGEGRGYASLTVPQLYSRKPAIPKGKIALKVKLAVPASLFSEFIPEGTITLPADASIGRPAIEVHVPEGLEITPDVKLALVPWPTPTHDSEEPR
jgi:hypothetical protein